MRIAVLVSGNGSNLQALIDACADGRIQGSIVAVFSNRKGAFGLERARGAGLPAVHFGFRPFREQGREAYDRALAEALAGYAPDLVVLAGFMRIVTAPFITAFPRVINLHPALPGEFDGLNAIERAWEAAQRGERTKTGVMVHEVIEQVDAGPVLGTRTVRIPASLEALEGAMHAAEHELLVEVVAGLAAHLA